MKELFRTYCLKHKVEKCANIYVNTLEDLDGTIFTKVSTPDIVRKLNRMQSHCTNNNQIPAYNKFIKFLEAPKLDGGMGLSLTGLIVDNIKR